MPATCEPVGSLRAVRNGCQPRQTTMLSTRQMTYIRRRRCARGTPHLNLIFAGCSSRLRQVHVPSPAVSRGADSCSSIAPDVKFDEIPSLGTRPRPSISPNATLGGNERHNVHSMHGERPFLRSMHVRGRHTGVPPGAKPRYSASGPVARYVARPTSAVLDSAPCRATCPKTRWRARASRGPRRSPACRTCGPSRTWTSRSSASRSTPASRTGSAAASGRTPSARPASCSGRTTRTSTSSRSTSCRASTTATSRSCPATPSGATRRSRRPSRRSSRPASSRCCIGGDHACTLPHLRATRSRGPGGGHRFRLAHRRLGQLLRRELQPRDVDAAGDRGGARRRRPLDRGRPARLALRRRATGPACERELGLDYLTTEDVFALGADAVAAADPRAGRRPPGVHQLRHRRRRPGLRARDGDAGGGRAVGARRCSRSCAA